VAPLCHPTNLALLQPRGWRKMEQEGILPVLEVGAPQSPALREGDELRGSFLSLESFPSKSEELWSCLCLLRDPFTEPDLISLVAHTSVYSLCLLI